MKNYDLSEENIRFQKNTKNSLFQHCPEHLSKNWRSIYAYFVEDIFIEATICYCEA